MLIQSKENPNEKEGSVSENLDSLTRKSNFEFNIKDSSTLGLAIASDVQYDVSATFREAKQTKSIGSHTLSDAKELKTQIDLRKSFKDVKLKDGADEKPYKNKGNSGSTQSDLDELIKIDDDSINSDQLADKIHRKSESSSGVQPSSVIQPGAFRVRGIDYNSDAPSTLAFGYSSDRNLEEDDTCANMPLNVMDAELVPRGKVCGPLIIPEAIDDDAVVKKSTRFKSLLICSLLLVSTTGVVVYFWARPQKKIDPPTNFPSLSSAPSSSVIPSSSLVPSSSFVPSYSSSAVPSHIPSISNLPSTSITPTIAPSFERNYELAMKTIIFEKNVTFPTRDESFSGDRLWRLNGDEQNGKATIVWNDVFFQEFLGDVDNDYFGTSVALSFDSMVVAISATLTGRVTIYNRLTISDQFIRHHTLVGKLLYGSFGTSMFMTDNSQVLVVTEPGLKLVDNSNIYVYARYHTNEKFVEIQYIDGLTFGGYMENGSVAIETSFRSLVLHAGYELNNVRTFELVCDCRDSNLFCSGFENFPALVCVTSPTFSPTVSLVPSKSLIPSTTPSTSTSPTGVPSLLRSTMPSTSKSALPSGVPSVSLIPSTSFVPSTPPSISMPPTKVNLEFRFILSTDRWGDQTSWNVTKRDNEILVISNPTKYESFEEYNNFFFIPSNECYKFIIYDSAGNGICCNNLIKGSFSIMYDGVVVGSGGEFNSSMVFLFGSCK